MHPIRAFFGLSLSATIPVGTYTLTVFDPADADCTITFNTSGSYSVTDTPGSSGTWKNSGTGAQYWIRWTNTSGTLSTGTAGSWQQLSSNRSFGVTQTIPGTKACTGTVEIATDSGGSNVIASGSITIRAVVEV